MTATEIMADTGQLTVTLRGSEDAVVAVGGLLDPAGGRRAVLLLQALLNAGVRRVIVDLSAVPVPPRSLTNTFGPMRNELRSRGGWMLIEGWSDIRNDAVEELLEAINAYRETV
jgi:hypothetical protein